MFTEGLTRMKMIEESVNLKLDDRNDLIWEKEDWQKQKQPTNRQNHGQCIGVLGNTIKCLMQV